MTILITFSHNFSAISIKKNPNRYFGEDKARQRVKNSQSNSEEA